MIFIETKLKGAYVIELEKNEDERGFFARSFCRKEFVSHGLNGSIAQGNITYNAKRGTLRGMHFQPLEKDKSVRCVRGGIYDVIIDLRKKSATYKQWLSVELAEGDYKMLYIPRDFAHGYLTLQDSTEIHYLMGRFYQPGSGMGIRHDDPEFKIRWPEHVEIKVMSDQDKRWPDFHRHGSIKGGSKKAAL